MTTQDKIAFIQQKCWEANLDDINLQPTADREGREYPGRKITLQDILLAIRKDKRTGEIQFLELDLGTDLGMRMGYGIEKAPTDWINYDLTKNVHDQSPETIDFIYSLLADN